MKSLTKVISGGQTGVDQGALRAAIDFGLDVGGWCPPGRLSESGPIPEEFQLTETPREHSEFAPEVPRSLRTEWNVRDADATLLAVPKSLVGDPGTNWSAEAALRHRRPVLQVDPHDAGARDEIARWVRDLGIATLNVAGPSESTAPGIEAATYKLMSGVFQDVQAAAPAGSSAQLDTCSK